MPTDAYGVGYPLTSALVPPLSRPAAAFAEAVTPPSEMALPSPVSPRGSGRGERARAGTPSPSLIIPITNVPGYVHRDWKTA